MNNFKKKIIHHTLLGQLIISIYSWVDTRLVPKTIHVKRQYKRTFGVALNLGDPKSLNEKIQWLKLNEKDPQRTLCSDKFKVRAYVEDKIGKEYLVPLVFDSKNITDLKPKNFPNIPVIIKTNHDSSGGIIVKDKNNADWEEIRKHFKKKLRQNYYYRSKEWQYKHIEKRLIVEQLLVGDAGELPFDYKVHCFDGKPEVIQVDIDRFTNHKRNLYLPNWDLAPFTWSVWEKGKILWDTGRPIEKPKKLKLMLKLAENLASNFNYVRVDFYICNDKIYFGELTFYHGGGFEKIIPKEWDYNLGKKLVLNQKLL
ncbi:ATP-grasp fold amidoligase family protein [Allomuricauda sp. F6463D]|uniref:ATP-grasp fold amidoligase family protein n=1 Tax=Allomuricauda sp. F6463D TaxID=2926409 RepID=UPI001FF500F9|nr:ATP-grasp fold amidoligase family protein [Muricauda sp. F6463D]MCK0159323.1 glycosyl transferase [Muricauda sp. F6463D]